MALKADRLIVETDTTNICNDVVAEKGLFLCYGNPGSGSALVDVNQGTVTLAASASGKTPAGMSLSTFVNIDQTRVHRNFQKDEQVVGEKAALVTKGYLVTDQILGTPTVGAKAYLGASGKATATWVSNLVTPPVGQFKSILDEAGFAKIEVNLPFLGQ